MTSPETSPESFPVPLENEPVRRRSTFSKDFDQLESHHALSPDDADAIRLRRKRKTHDSSLQLIDDLVNRPMDPMFSDSRLVTEQPSTATKWITRAIVFLLCIAAGIACVVSIRQLQTDPRKSVRQTLITQLQEQNEELNTLTNDVQDLRTKVEEASKSITGVKQSDTLLQDEMTNGNIAVKGPGITLTIANPVSDQAGMNSSIRTITDRDLQNLTSLLFQSGAEAIAINGNRIGAQTSIRTAGNHILIGMTAIEAPYTIQAIGNKNDLYDALSEKNQQSLYDSFKEAGITLKVSKTNSMQIDAAILGELQFAERTE